MRTPEQLAKVASLCRDMADSCLTDEARDALLEVSEDLQSEADEMMLTDNFAAEAPLIADAP